MGGAVRRGRVEPLSETSGRSLKFGKAIISATDLPERAVYSKTDLAAIRYAIGFVLAGSACFVISILALAPDQTLRALGPATLSLVAAAAWFLLSRGKFVAAIHLLVFGLWTAVTGIAFFNGGIRGMAIIVYPQLILILGWLVGTRAAVAMAVLAIAATFGFVLAESFDLLPAPPHTPPMMRWIVNSFIFAFSVALVSTFVRSYQERLKQADKLAAELARRSAELNHAQAVARVGSWTYEIDTGVTHASAETCRIFDVPDGTTAQRKTYIARIHPDDRAALVEAWQASLRNDAAFDHEHRIVIGDTTRWVRQLAVFERDPDGRPRRSIGTVQDITERKVATEALRQSERDLREAQAVGRVGSYVFDIPGDLWTSSPMLDTIFGIGAEFPRTMASWTQIVHPAEREDMVAYFLGLLAERRHFEREYRIVRANDGAERWVFGLGKVDYGAKGEPLRMVGSIQDVTERKHYEQELEGLNRELERRVEQRTHELLMANRELESFAYSVSHDLRAPLRAIEGFSTLLEQDYAPRLDARGKDYFRRVRGGATRMGTLIDDMLKLSRISRQEMRREPVDLSALVREAAEELTGTGPERKVEWIIAPQVRADGDPGLLRVVVQNLIGNAWKYTSKRASACIEFGICIWNGRAAYFVRDNGAGFDMAYADKLFGAFQRLHSPGEFSGSGIGLATVKRIVHRHGGEVGAEGRTSEGATFYFTL